MRIVGLVSSYKEGSLVTGAVTSLLSACDAIYVYEGPIAGAPDAGEKSEIPKEIRRVVYGEWDSDAIKRTELLERARREWQSAPLWAVMLDGDELLMNGRYLADYLRRAPDDAISYHIPMVDMDGSVGTAHNKIVRADLIRRYVVSGYQVELMSGMIVALPLVPINKEEWWTGPRAESPQLFVFPPLPGEPHIVHRSLLRPPERNAFRLHEVEGDWFKEKTAKIHVPGRS